MLKYLTFIIGAFIMLSCETPHYIPPVRPSAMHTQSHEAVVTTAYGSSGAGPFLSYSLADNFSLSASGMYNWYSYSSTRYSYFDISGTRSELKNDQFYMGFTFGPGFGRVFKDVLQYPDTLIPRKIEYSSFIKLFVQPTIGFSSDYFDVYFNCRIAYMNFLKIYTYSPTTNKQQSIFFEPAIGLQGGYKFIKLFLQLGFVFPTTKNNTFYYEPVFMNFGLRSKFSLRKDL